MDPQNSAVRQPDLAISVIVEILIVNFLIWGAKLV